MGLFTSLFSPKAPENPSGRKELVYLMGIGQFDQEISGVEHHQDVLEAICGPRSPRGSKQFHTVSLKLEDDHPRDKNAVRVEIQGKRIGYLRPEAASWFRRRLIARGLPKGVGQCAAVIRGGWVSSDGRKGPYEVWLDLPTWSLQ